MPTELNLEQGSAEWLAFRQNGIGGSDASLIAAFFLDQPWPYGTWAGADLWKLWAQKVGRIKVKPARDRSDAATGYVDPFVHGHKTEPLARDWYSQTTGEFAPPAVLQSTEREFMFASLDGWNPETKVVLEIKCPKEKAEHNRAKEGQIPERYYAQFQHNLCVAEGTELHYVSFFEGDGVLIKVQPDKPFLERLIAAEVVFWEWVRKKDFPIPTGDLVASEEDVGWKNIVDRYFQAQEAMRKAEAEISLARKEVMRTMMMRGAGKMRGHGARASLRVRNEQTIRAFTKDAGLELRVQEASNDES